MTAFGKSLLVLGGARSGKSRYAQAQAEAVPGELVYIATAQAFDDEMTGKIARHRADRGTRWQTVEAPVDLPEAIAAADGAAVILVDCLTLWASNLLLTEADADAATDALVAAIAASASPIILVSNEVGLGIVPANDLARRFRDVAGDINQRVGACVDTVRLMVAGFGLTLKE